MTLIQNLGTKIQGVVRYDVYDPNTDVNGSDIGALGSSLSATDLAYTTWGLGLIYHWDENVKLTAYYDIVSNEEANAAASGILLPYKKDLPDNVFTFRMQMKF